MPTVLVYRDHLFAVSETFVYAPYRWMRAFQAVFLGSKFARPRGAYGVDPDRVYTIHRSRWGMQEALFKFWGTIPGSMDAWIRTQRPDLIHAYFAPDGALALSLASRYRLPLVVSLLGSDITMQESRILRSSYPTHRLYLLRKGALMRRAHRFVVPSRFLLQKALERGYPEEKLVLLPHGVDTGQFSPDPAQVERHRILFVGRLVELKGLHFLLEAVRVLLPAFPELRLVVIGDGPERPRYEAWVQTHLPPGKVVFLGAQPQHVVVQEMRKAWVFVLPTLPMPSGQVESFGMVFLEAQASGCPVVSFAVGGVPEVVRDGETGVLVRERNVEHLARALQHLLEHEQMRRRMSEAARAWVLRTFDLRRTTEKLESLYMELLGMRNTRR